MSQSRKHRGYKSQDIVADYLATHGWPFAQAVGAGRRGTDITGSPGIDWEVAARRGFDVTLKMQQAVARCADGVLPCTVLRPDGWGPARVAMWPFIVPLAIGVDLLHGNGYGDTEEAAS